MVHVVSVLANERLVRTRQNGTFFNILPSIKNVHTHCCQKVHTRLENCVRL